MKKHKEGIALAAVMIAISAVLSFFLLLTNDSASASIPPQLAPSAVAGAKTAR